MIQIDGPITSIWMFQIHGVKVSIWRFSFVKMDNTCSYIWMRPKQRHIACKWAHFKKAVQVASQIQIDGESPLIWTVWLNECPNTRPFTVNLDVLKTPFGVGSLYGLLPSCPPSASLPPLPGFFTCGGRCLPPGPSTAASAAGLSCPGWPGGDRVGQPSVTSRELDFIQAYGWLLPFV